MVPAMIVHLTFSVTQAVGLSLDTTIPYLPRMLGQEISKGLGILPLCLPCTVQADPGQML